VAHQDPDLALADAMMLACVLNHARADRRASVFATRNSKDFGAPAIKQKLRDVGCDIVFSFGDALQRIENRS